MLTFELIFNQEKYPFQSRLMYRIATRIGASPTCSSVLPVPHLAACWWNTTSPNNIRAYIFVYVHTRIIPRSKISKLIISAFLHFVIAKLILQRGWVNFSLPLYENVVLILINIFTLVNLEGKGHFFDYERGL